LEEGRDPGFPFRGEGGRGVVCPTHYPQRKLRPLDKNLLRSTSDHKLK
jgi:hypothetical protein